MGSSIRFCVTVRPIDRAVLRCCTSYSSSAACGASPCLPDTICSTIHSGKKNTHAGSQSNGAHRIPNAHITLTKAMKANVAANPTTSARRRRCVRQRGSEWAYVRSYLRNRRVRKF